MTPGCAALLLLLAAHAPPEPPAPPPSPVEVALRARLDAGLAAHPAGAERAAWAAGVLRGQPYRTSPLGEGQGRDPDPRFRLDAFDCVTLVETALALGASGSSAEATARLDGIRYAGPPSWEGRLHYVESQWLPALVAGGWLEPATSAVAGARARPAEKVLDAATWARAERAGRVVPGLPAEARPSGTFVLEVIPLAQVAAVADRIPHGTLLLVVREDRPDRPSRVTHMGLVVVGTDGRRLVRHASDVPSVLRVRDEPLPTFLERASRRRWPVTGVSLYAVTAPDQKAKAITPPATTPAAATP
jgi:hypothetical protein